MNTTTVTAVYFSATGNSQKIAMAVAAGMGDRLLTLVDTNPTVVDVTPCRFLQEECLLGPDTVAVFCAPVYMGRLPAQTVEHFKKVKGQGTPAVITVSFGNRDYDDALLELWDLACENGFVPIAAGAFSGRHTFGKIALDRPNAADLAQANALGQAAAQRLQEVQSPTELPPIQVKGNRPYKAIKMSPAFPPKTSSACNKCGLCVNLCPTGAIPANDPTSVDKSKCMSCFGCVRACPTQAKTPGGMLYPIMAGVLGNMLKKPAPNSLFTGK